MKYTKDQTIELTGATGIGQFLDAFVGKSELEINNILIYMFGYEGDDPDLSAAIKSHADNYKNLGTVNWQGKTLYLLRQAYADNQGTDGELVYKAPAVDVDETEYQIVWNTIEVWNDHIIGDNGVCAVENCGGWCEDESNACDWDNPSKINITGGNPF